MVKRLVFLSLLSVLLLSACNNADELSGKTFDVSSRSIHDENSFYAIMTLEFSDGNVTTISIDGEEGAYELKDDKLLIQYENENETLEIEFTLEESDEDSSTYSAIISDADFQIEDSDQVSKYRKFYTDLPSFPVEFIER
jgi:hypothetical protein